MIREKTRAFLIFCFLQSLVALQIIFANRDGMLTVEQMNGRGVSVGFPLIWHFAVWSDAVCIAPLAALLVYAFGHAWNALNVTVAAALCACISVALTTIFTLTPIQDAWMHHHATTPAGIAHLTFMITAMPPIVLLLFDTPHADPRTIATCSMLLVIHAFIGLNMVLGVVAQVTPLPWYPSRPLGDPLGWLQITVIAVAFWWRYAQTDGRDRDPPLA